MSAGQCPSGYIELPTDKTKCRHPTGDATTVPKICPAGFHIDVSGLCLVNAAAAVEPTCPSGYFPIAGDSSNCMTSTTSTVVMKTCPTGYTLQNNGLCGTGATYSTSGPAYCGPQYTGKNCTYRAQVTAGITAATGTEGTESSPNMICAFREGDAQFPCDPGCCEPPVGTSGSGDGTSGSGDGTSEDSFPIWAIILLIVLGAVALTVFFVFIAYRRKVMSSSS